MHTKKRIYTKGMHYISWCFSDQKEPSGNLYLDFTYLYIVENIVVIQPYHHTCKTCYVNHVYGVWLISNVRM